MPICRIARWLLSAGILVLSTTVAYSQDYPNRSIRILTPATGGSSDIAARQIAQGITGPLGQPVIVDNRGGTISQEIAAKAPPDGYTLLEGGSGIWLTQFMKANVPWDPLRDFSPVTQVERSPLIVVVHPELPVKSIKELIALAKAKPGELNYAAAVAGGSHLGAELFKAMAGVNIVHVPYKGAALAAIGLIGGEAHVAFSGAGGVAPHLKSGKVRPIAVTGIRPSMWLPELPTVASSGVPGFDVVAFDVVFVPAKTPTAIINRLNREIVQVLNRPEVKERLLLIGTEVVTSSPEEFAATLKTEMAKWGKLIKDIGLRTE